MQRSHVNQTTPGHRPEPIGRRPLLPSWLGSLLLHAAVFVLIAWALRLARPQGVSDERTAEVGIALKHRDGQFEYFDRDGQTAGDAAASTAATSTDSLEDLLSDRAAIDTSAALPATTGLIGPSVVEPGRAFDPGTPAGGYPGSRSAIGGEATVRVFGVEGTGYKFVYVFDRSASMGGSGWNALEAAKAQLLNSLESLDKMHQFQIIFYNEEPLAFNPSGQPGKLPFATQRTKDRARRFVGQIVDQGATRHEAALKLAIGFQPDVIFFLTDADEPRLSPRQLNDVRRWAAGISVNTIEFGRGLKQSGDNFLVKLARQNGGQYCYVDINKDIRPAR